MCKTLQEKASKFVVQVIRRCVAMKVYDKKSPPRNPIHLRYQCDRLFIG